METKMNNEKIKFYGKIFDMDFDGTKVYELEHSKVIDIIEQFVSEYDTEKDGSFVASIKDDLLLENQIIFLFAIGDSVSAWKYIEDNMTELNYSTILNSKFFTIDREAIDVFQYMYNENIIDITTYMYFNAIHGSVFDPEAFKEYILNNCTSLKEMFEAIYNMYNGISPYEIGLLEETDVIRELIEHYGIDKDVQYGQYIAGNKTSVFLSVETIKKFVFINGYDVCKAINAILIINASLPDDIVDYIMRHYEKDDSCLDITFHNDTQLIGLIGSLINHPRFGVPVLQRILVGNKRFAEMPYRIVKIIRNADHEIFGGILKNGINVNFEEWNWEFIAYTMTIERYSNLFEFLKKIDIFVPFIAPYGKGYPVKFIRNYVQDKIVMLYETMTFEYDISNSEDMNNFHIDIDELINIENESECDSIEHGNIIQYIEDLKEYISYTMNEMLNDV